MTEYLSIGEAARTLGLSIGEVLRLVNTGKLTQRTTAYDALPIMLISLESVEEFRGRRIAA